MHSFFNSWRRKAGCVTLVMACMIVGLWIRSFVVSDTLVVSLGPTLIQSDNQQLIVATGDGWREFKWANLYWVAGTPYPRSQFHDFNIKWRVRWPGLGIGRYRIVEPNHFRRTFLGVSDWLLSIPLSLLSACLILWRPRPKPKDQTSA